VNSRFERKGGRNHPWSIIHRIALNFVCATVFIRFCLRFFPFLISLDLWNNLGVLELCFDSRIVVGWDTLFGSLHIAYLSSSWSWSKLILFWVRLRKPQQNPNQNGISDLRMEFWFVHVNTSQNNCFPLRKLSINSKGNYVRFFVCPTLLPLWAARPLVLPCVFTLIFYRQLSRFLGSSMVYSINIRLSIIVLRGFVVSWVCDFGIKSQCSQVEKFLVALIHPLPSSRLTGPSKKPHARYWEELYNESTNTYHLRSPFFFLLFPYCHCFPHTQVINSNINSLPLPLCLTIGGLSCQTALFLGAS
jgi:hypothetical protein